MPKLTEARKELADAATAIATLRTLSDFAALDTEWKKFLHHLERGWFKTMARMKINSRWQGWPRRGHIERLRCNDPVLSYLRFARGAEEHSVEAITEMQSGSVSVRGLPAKDRLHIRRLEVSGNALTIEPGETPVEIEVRKPAFKLREVKFRGHHYAVPTSHEGIPLQDTTPTGIAEVALAFYQRAMDEIEAEFPA